MTKDEFSEVFGSTSRRTIVKTGTKLAYAVPIVAASMKLGTSAAGAAVSGTPCQGLATRLSGANEVPPNDSDGTGLFTAIIKPGVLEYVLQFSGLSSDVVAAHIHRAKAGFNGPVVVPLDVTTGIGSPAVDQTLLDEFASNPAGFYVNVHTTTFPGGEIRGQLSCG